MKIIDLTYTINNSIKEYPEDPKTEIKYFKKPTPKDSLTLSEIRTGLHIGTHMDAPLHYINNSKKISDINIEKFIDKASIIKNNKFKNNIEKIVIIKTGWSKYWGDNKYFYNYPTPSIEFIQHLINENIKGIAIDTCSVDKNNENIIHKILLKNNIWIVENIANIEKLNKKKYEAYFIPLKIEAEASPVRAYVIDK